MKRIGLVLALLFAALPFAAVSQVPTAPAPAQNPSVIGTFDRSTIVLAFYRSPQWAAILANSRYDMKVAKAENDTAGLKYLEHWGGARQDQAEQQLWGHAPIDNVLAVLEPEFRDLKTKMKLSDVVDASSADPKATTVDVTAVLMDWLHSSAETRRMAAELHTKQQSGK